MYPVQVGLFIGGAWRQGSGGRTLPVLNPATEEIIGRVAVSETADLDLAVQAATAGFTVWKKTPVVERARILRKAAELMRAEADSLGAILSLEHGKPLAQGIGEVIAAAEVIEWCAEQGRRVYGQIIQSRAEHIDQFFLKEPVGIVAAFTPWNFPLNQAVKKIAPALATGCAMIIKCPEETPASCARLVELFAQAGLPDGVLNLVFGIPAEVSGYLIPHPAVRKVSFTGSTAVGKQLAALAGSHMKRITMELGGHSPAIVFDDADVDLAVQVLSVSKFRNAGQICSAPSRFLVQSAVYDRFVDSYVAAANAVAVGDPFDEKTAMGPLANDRRLHTMERLIGSAVDDGAKVQAGGARLGNRGYFFAPTVVTDVTPAMQIMNEEPFGPVAPIMRFDTEEEAVNEANRLAYGLAAFAYTRSAKRVRSLTASVETGMLSVNHQGLALPETPFGGVKDSGFGWEGGPDALEPYLAGKFVSHATS